MAPNEAAATPRVAITKARITTSIFWRPLLRYFSCHAHQHQRLSWWAIATDTNTKVRPANIRACTKPTSNSKP